MSDHRSRRNLGESDLSTKRTTGKEGGIFKQGGPSQPDGFRVS